MANREILGFIPIHEILPGCVATAALVSCSVCGAPIRGMGGPLDGALCLPCTSEALSSRLSGSKE